MTDFSISVAIITRNRAEMLKKSLHSLMAQSRKADEVCVIDNNSTDTTKNVIEHAAKNLPIKYIFEKSIGVGYARNAALKTATGDILAFIDDDAVAKEDWLAQLENSFHQHPEAVAVQGRTNNMYPDSTIASLLQFTSQDMPKLRDRDASIVKSPSMICTMNLAVMTRKIKEVGVFFDPSLTRGEDRDFGHQLMRKRLLIVYEEKAVNLHHWPKSFSGYGRMRWNAGIAKALLKKKLQNASYENETRKWGIRKTLKTAFSFLDRFSARQKFFFIFLLFLGKIITETGHYYTIYTLKNE